MSVTIAATAGSLRPGPHTRALLRATARDVPPGIRLAIWDGLARVPPYSGDAEAGPAPAGVAALRQLIAGAGAVPIVTPEHNGPIQGQLKNALDWASRPRGAAVLEGKPAAAISASPGPRGGGCALADLRKVLTLIGADLSGTELAVPPGPHPAHPGRPHRRPGPARAHHRAMGYPSDRTKPGQRLARSGRRSGPSCP
jgi:chromate reductase